MVVFTQKPAKKGITPVVLVVILQIGEASYLNNPTLWVQDLFFEF